MRCPPTSRHTHGATSSYRAGLSESGAGWNSNRFPSATLISVRPTRPITVRKLLRMPRELSYVPAASAACSAVVAGSTVPAVGTLRAGK